MQCIPGSCLQYSVQAGLRQAGIVWAGACDLGLPDSEICSGLTTPPVAMSSLQEAWSRGCGTMRCLLHDRCTPCCRCHICHNWLSRQNTPNFQPSFCTQAMAAGPAGAAEQLLLRAGPIRGPAQGAHLRDAVPHHAGRSRRKCRQPVGDQGHTRPGHWDVGADLRLPAAVPAAAGKSHLPSIHSHRHVVI